MNVKVKFLGGAKSVTGSKYLIQFEEPKFNILVDCGLFQGKYELRRRNWDDFPVDPDTIDAIIITHGHLDHVGYLPRLIRQGYDKKVYCSHPSKDLIAILLRDSAKLQENEAAFIAKKGYSKHKNPEPLYNQVDAERSIKLLESFCWSEPLKINDSLSVTFSDSGHILGSSILTFVLKGKDQTKRIVFSGDLGRYDQPVFNDPKTIESADILFVESTYGNRDNIRRDTEAEIADIVNDAYDKGGSIIIPAFAIGRTQLITYYVYDLMTKGKIPTMPIFVDSPMAQSVTKLYSKHPDWHRLDVSECCSVFDYEQIKYTNSAKESKSINKMKKPCIIISASGMVTGGRILHHLFHRLPKENDTVLFVGYQAENSRGRRILNGESTIKIYGEEVAVNCNIAQISGLSAHADKSDLLRWLGEFKNTPKKTFIIHGEQESANELQKTLIEEKYWTNVIVPDYLQKEVLFTHV